MKYKYSYAVGPAYPTDNTMLLINNHLKHSKEYLIESAPWAIIGAFAHIDSERVGGAIFSIPDVVGDFLWFMGDDDTVESD